MRVKSFGCSFTWGTDLPDESFFLAKPSKLTWSALVANHLNAEYTTFATPGCGNFYIADRVLNQCANSTEQDFFIINWTYIDRFDYIVDNGQLPSSTPIEWAGESPWKTCRPGENHDYYKNYHSEFRDKLASLQLVKLCIDTLLQHKIHFIMTAIDDLMFDQRWHTSSGMLMLQHYAQPHITKFDGKNFLDYVINLGHKQDNNGHVDEHAHYAAAQCIINSSDIQNISDC